MMYLPFPSHPHSHLCFCPFCCLSSFLPPLSHILDPFLLSLTHPTCHLRFSCFPLSSRKDPSTPDICLYIALSLFLFIPLLLSPHPSCSIYLTFPSPLIFFFSPPCVIILSHISYFPLYLFFSLSFPFCLTRTGS